MSFLEAIYNFPPLIDSTSCEKRETQKVRANAGPSWDFRSQLTYIHTCIHTYTHIYTYMYAFIHTYTLIPA